MGEEGEVEENHLCKTDICGRVVVYPHSVRQNNYVIIAKCGNFFIYCNKKENVALKKGILFKIKF